jgi:Ca2+-binding RTX toxin-like protein
LTQVLAPVGGGSNVGEAITLTDGGYMVVWSHLVTNLLPIPNVTDELATAVLGRVFNSDGTPRGAVFQVNQSNANSGQGNADIALLSNGNVVVVWTDGPNATDFDVAARGRIFTPTGTPVTDEFDLSTSTQRDQRMPQVAANDSGGFFATWSDGRSPWSNTDEQWLGQEFDANGNRVGAELWIRNDRTSEDSDLVHLNDGFYALMARNGRTFDSDARYTFTAAIESSTNSTGNAPDAGSFNSNAATDGDGNVAVVQPFNSFTVSVSLWSPQTVPNGSRESYPDGTPFATSITGLNTDPETISQRDIRLQWILFGEPGYPNFTPQTFHAPAADVAYMPDGNIAVVWTGVSGGTRDFPLFSVYAQILSPEGIILSPLRVIADQNVVGSSLAPPFISAGADGRLFIGWTGTTDRNGAGTNEVMGGVFDIPTYPPGSDIPGFGLVLFVSGTMATDGTDTVTGVAPVDFNPTPALYLMDGDDVWTQGAATQPQGVFGMNGNDRFIVTDASLLDSLSLRPGLGRDTLDLSGSTTAFTGFLQVTDNFNSEASTQGQIEVVIGSLLDDTFSAPEYLNTYFYLGGPLPAAAYLHAEAGNDTISFSQSSGGVVDGGEGFDVMTTFGNRAQYELTFHGDHYTLGYLSVPLGGTAPPAVQPENVMTLRSIEEVRFADQTVTLQTTASQFSGGAVFGPVLPEGIIGTPGADRLTGTEGADQIQGLGGSDVLLGLGGNDTLYGGDGTDTVNGGLGDDFLFGGSTTADLRDVIYGGDGNDSTNGGNGNDTVLGDFGSDTVVGNDGNDVLAGGAGSDLMFGNAGNDSLYGGFGYDRMNGGAGADSFFHLGVADHASDWIQDYNAAEGDVLTVGLAGATRSQFQINTTFTLGAGSAAVQEAFVIYRPTGQILWALVDGGDDAVINVNIGGAIFDLLT